MPAGPGKYDNECTTARESTGADAVVLVVFNGHHGHGFAVQSAAGPMGMEALCRSLEAIVAEIRANLPPGAPEDVPPAFTCPRCGAQSWNQMDRVHQYCGRCHLFVDDMKNAKAP